MFPSALPRETLHPSPKRPRLGPMGASTRIQSDQTSPRSQRHTPLEAAGSALDLLAETAKSQEVYDECISFIDRCAQIDLHARRWDAAVQRIGRSKGSSLHGSEDESLSMIRRRNVLNAVRLTFVQETLNSIEQGRTPCFRLFCPA